MITQKFQHLALLTTAQVKGQDDSEGEVPVVLSNSWKWGKRKMGRKRSSVDSK